MISWLGSYPEVLVNLKELEGQAANVFETSRGFGSLMRAAFFLPWSRFIKAIFPMVKKTKRSGLSFDQAGSAQKIGRDRWIQFESFPTRLNMMLGYGKRMLAQGRIYKGGNITRNGAPSIDNLELSMKPVLDGSKRATFPHISAFLAAYFSASFGVFSSVS